METEEPLVIRQNTKIGIQTNITAQICNFSTEVSTKRQIKKRLSVKEFDELILECNVFNISKLQGRGYIAIQIKLHLNLKVEYVFPVALDSLTLNSSVSVLDVAGNKRFTRIISQHHKNDFLNFGKFDTSDLISEYLSRQTLLNDPTEFLPNDILTIEIDISFALDSSLPNEQNILKNTFLEVLMSSSYELVSDSCCKLFLNSIVTKTLCHVSKFFRDIFVYTPGDNSSEYLEFPYDDAKVLLQISKIVNGVEHEIIRVFDIFELLRISDKYDILNLPEICRQFIKEFCGNKMLSPIWKKRLHLELLMVYANKCRDTTVMELVEAFVKRQDSNFEFQENGDYGISGIDSGVLCPPHLKEKCTYEPSLGFQITTNSISNNCYYN